MADESLTENSTDLSKLKVPDLKKELKVRGLSTTGNKTELIERLQAALKSNENISSESVDDLEEVLLNDEDDEHLDASESVILDNDLDEAPPVAVKRKIEETSPSEVKSDPPKKIKINRNNSTNSDSDTDKPEKPVEKAPEVKPDEEKSEEKKVVKLSELTAKERLEMRAKKFGVGVTALSVDAKKAVRAERFGTTNTSASSITSSKVNTNLDVLKQRAARFGGSVSTAMSSLENKEKMEKRKQRFGSDSTEKTTNGVSESEKAKLRLDRFKEPVK